MAREYRVEILRPLLSGSARWTDYYPGSIYDTPEIAESMMRQHFAYFTATGQEPAPARISSRKKAGAWRPEKVAVEA